MDREGDTYIVIPSGQAFMMGTVEDEPDRGDTPETIHRVQIPRSYAIADRPVTAADFEVFLRECKVPQGLWPGVNIRKMAPEDDCPAINVSWLLAAAYCNFRSSKEGIREDQWCYPTSILEAIQRFQGNKPSDLNGDSLGHMAKGYLDREGYRLPTEAEWEFACRAGTETARPFGRSDRLLGEYAYFAKNTGDKRSFPVGSLKPNELGLFDMPGNVMQWCQALTAYPAQRLAETRIDRDDEAESSIVPDNRNEQNRVLRGGAWLSRPIFHRSGSRKDENNWHPYHGYGFRLARTLAPSS